MKFVAGLLGLCGVGMVLNALSNQWAFNQHLEGGKYVALDLVVAVGLFVASFLLWQWNKRREIIHAWQRQEMAREVERRRADEGSSGEA